MASFFPVHLRDRARAVARWARQSTAPKLRLTRGQADHIRSMVRPEVEDGFGMTAIGCWDRRCDIQVVRPGKVQCSNFCGREGRGDW